MGKLAQIGNIIIRIYANDHLPPHFHIFTPDGDALVEIATLEILRGKLASKAQDTALEWAAKNKATIAAEWNRTNPRFPIA
ncbi:uncharacterized protein DUF4160 [Rhizobium sp. ERR 922]|uniref:DUF4160 domain-containing protein n=1 Tax=Rhizobium dioscoreae TaxID=2653122 RepID=A0ABQ0Z7U4_9HYPH|nr:MULTISPECIES: DUF4160 domain-containing protein [Rhizobium]MCZ3374666.1 DUF4160 domain-containing protein [Rhizobium sp. AG207R]TWB10908.1 uncharacterized protein DUF4160 [Rhizobium sp. ERR1071]TWB48573.1 uncharacterized protein DUF4160 [Rhizobium sp. ERR 922]TWB90294.1 uncharacterized protein DUF4160 [Rhizobium sp. ERR 942]GES41485.1 hypothetical protein RsS62_07370 [Rhizobium dioscoreae]